MTNSLDLPVAADLRPAATGSSTPKPISALNLSAHMRDHDADLAAVQVGVDVDDCRVVITLDPERAQFLASILGQIDSNPNRLRDLSAFTVDPADREIWIHALVDILAAASLAQSPLTVGALQLAHDFRPGRPLASVVVEGKKGAPGPEPGAPATPDVRVTRVFECPNSACEFVAVEVAVDDVSDFDSVVESHRSWCANVEAVFFTPHGGAQ